jgi:hypothetical protein
VDLLGFDDLVELILRRESRRFRLSINLNRNHPLWLPVDDNRIAHLGRDESRTIFAVGVPAGGGVSSS